MASRTKHAGSSKNVAQPEGALKSPANAQNVALTRVWVSFKLNDRRPDRKTDTWEIWSLDEASHIGQVRWYSPWRKYCFFPAGETVWEQDCLRLIAEFIESETAKHRKGKRAFPPEVPA